MQMMAWIFCVVCRIWKLCQKGHLWSLLSMDTFRQKNISTHMHLHTLPKTVKKVFISVLSVGFAVVIERQCEAIVIFKTDALGRCIEL